MCPVNPRYEKVSSFQPTEIDQFVFYDDQIVIYDEVTAIAIFMVNQNNIPTLWIVPALQLFAHGNFILSFILKQNLKAFAF